jgi:hypothetical protein
MSREPWYCPNCVQTSTRRWNIRVHIQRKHRGIHQPVRNGESARQHSPFNSAVMGQNKTVDDNPYGECDRIQEITDKLVILKTLLFKYLPKEDVARIIDLCCGASLGSGKNIVLENYLESARR